MFEKLPRELRSFVCELSSVNHSRELLGRLKHLEGFGMQHQVDEHAKIISKINEMELEISRLKQKASDKALSIFADCLSLWTIEEIQKATGYYVED